MFVIPYTTSSRHTVSPRTARGFGRAFDRLFDTTFDASFERHVNDTAAATQVRTPAMDVSESDTAYTVVFDVPGATKAQLKVTVEGRRVSIETAETSVAAAPADSTATDASPAAPAMPAEAAPAQRALYRERAAARYARTVSLPAEVDQASSQARFDNGVLTLTLTKRVPTGATRLNVD